MAFVPGFENDIFISYASDNNVEVKEGKGWVTHFRDRLEKEMRCHIGKNFKVWMDGIDIVVGDDFKDKIIRGIEKSATLLIIMSNAYLNSDWCTMERKAFLEYVNKLKLSGIDGVSGLKRIFIVRFQDVPVSKTPEGLKGLHHIDFFRVDDEEKVHPLGWPLLLETDPHYFKYTDKITVLSTDLTEHLKELKTTKEKITNSLPNNDEEPNDETGKRRTFFNKMMRKCQGLIVIYGESDEEWVTLMLERSITAQRDNPIHAGAIIEGPPDKEKEMLQFKPSFMRKIDCTKEFNLEELKDFFSELSASLKKKSNTEDSGDTLSNLGAMVFVNAIGKDRLLAKKICDLAETYNMSYCSPK